MTNRYKCRADATLGAILLYAFCGVALMVVASVIYYFVCFPSCGLAVPTNDVILLTPFFFFLATVVIVRRRLIHACMQTWAYMLLLTATVLAFCFSLGWFRDPMHDIGMFFGSHGRWGCYCPGYLIRDRTAPWLLFGPVVIASVGHWIWNKQRTQITPPHGTP